MKKLARCVTRFAWQLYRMLEAAALNPAYPRGLAVSAWRSARHGYAFPLGYPVSAGHLMTGLLRLLVAQRLPLAAAAVLGAIALSLLGVAPAGADINTVTLQGRVCNMSSGIEPATGHYVYLPKLWIITTPAPPAQAAVLAICDPSRETTGSCSSIAWGKCWSLTGYLTTYGGTTTLEFIVTSAAPAPDYECQSPIQPC